jgi:3-phosphoshikimate 1-carboxyvinyltransferase
VKSISIEPVAGPVRGVARPPGSKSLTNRALVCAALAEGASTLTGALDSEDTRVMIAALEQLGIGVTFDPAARTLQVSGCGGVIPASDADLFIANSGTTVRFLTALVALGAGRFRLDGTPRMRERPIADLLAALEQVHVNARSELGTGCPPVIVEAAGLPGGAVAIRGDVSSQFLSALLMVAPYARGPMNLTIAGQLVSQPYVHMTLAVMRAFGVDVNAGNLSRFAIQQSRYRGRPYAIEPDASAASYFWAAAAITGGAVTVAGLNRDSLQGDVAFCECLGQMGCEVRYDSQGTTVIGGPLTGVDVDMNAISDTAQTLGVVALFATGPTTIRGVGHIRHKETDRIGALATELRKLGAQVDERADGLRITPAAHRGASIDTYDDHRMAMSLALAGLKIPGVTINDPDCTAKTYPEFFVDLAALCSSSL